MKILRTVIAVFVVAMVPAAALSQEVAVRPVSVRDLVEFRRLLDKAKVSPDGATVAYAVAEPDLDRDAPDIVIYVGALPPIVRGQIDPRRFEPRPIMRIVSLDDLQWAADSKSLLVLHRPADAPRNVISRVDVLSGMVVRVISSPMTIERFALQGEDSDVLVTGYYPPVPKPDERGVIMEPGDPIYIRRQADRNARRETHLFTAGEERFVRYETGGRDEEEVPDRSRLDQRGDIVIGIKESIHDAPELRMTVATTGARRTLTDLNASLDALKLGRVELMEWSAAGKRLWGHIIYPASYRKGERYPCAILAKSWKKDGFYFESQSTYPYGNFPAQALAGSGILVLMLARGDILHGDRDTYDARGSRTGYGSARDELARRGLVDPARCGLMGFSHTGWQVTYLITHPDERTPWATAIAVDHYNRDYALGSLGRYTRDAKMGPADRRIPALWIPYLGQLSAAEAARFNTVDDVRAAYLRRSAAWNASAVRTPLLQVSHNEPDSPSELFGALRLRGKPVELVWMPDATHTLETPQKRYWSMQRVVDWFRFWLQDYERPSVPEDPERYGRWRELREQHRQNERWIAEGKDPNAEWWKTMPPVNALNGSVNW